MDDEHDIPQALIAELEKRDRPMPIVTARVDRALADAAAAQFASRTRQRRRHRGWLAAAAAALALFALQPRYLGMDEPSGMYADVDGSGRIDIADVLTLARASHPDVSQADLDAFAMRVVSLGSAGETP